MFLINVLLALVWAALTGDFSYPSLFFGFALGYGMLWLARGWLDADGYFKKFPRLIGFVFYFIWELIKANVHVAGHVLSLTRHKMQPGIVAVPLDVKRDGQITMLANLITLTPGTLSLDVSDDRRVLYVHAIEVGEPETFRRDTKAGFERAVREVSE